jgi:uncharacterized protein with FMN-binding domain
MPRVIPALLLTAIAAWLLFNFHPSQEPVAVTSPVTPEPPARSRAGQQRSATHHRHPRRRTVVGAPVHERFGTVQVAAKLRGSRIVGVRFLRIPLDGHSRAVNSRAMPLLRSETLRAQSPDVDVVSGATYTSEAYARSLQAALNRARA